MTKNNKVLILGGTGFLGGNLAKKMCSDGYQVTCLGAHAPTCPVAGVQYIRGDFFDDTLLERLTREHDILYHAVSSLNPGNSNQFYMRGYEKDFIQSVKLCDWVDRYHKKLIFFSSGGTVYGCHSHQPIREDAACRPINHYGTIKRCIETAMLTFQAQHGTRLSIARLSNPYGPGQDYLRGVGVIDAALKRAQAGLPMEIWGDGCAVRDYLYVDDACAMLEALAEYEGSNCVFNLSSGQGSSVNDILTIVRQLYPSLQVEYKPARSVDLEKVILDNSRIRSLYSAPLVPLKEGIFRYAHALEAHSSLER